MTICRGITLTLGMLFVSKILRLDLVANSAVVLGGIATAYYFDQNVDSKQRTITDQELTALQNEFKKESKMIKFQYAFVGSLTFLGEFLSNRQNLVGALIGGLLMACVFFLPYGYALRALRQPMEIINTKKVQAE